MKNRVHFLFWVVGIALLTCSGCNTSNERDPDKIDSLAFVDASHGLPESGSWRQGLDFYDMNGDGHKDILAPPPRHGGDGYKGPVVWYGNGKGEWEQASLKVPENVSFDYGSIQVADFDGDGIPDIALAMHDTGLRVLKGTENGAYASFSEGLPGFTEFASRALVCADFTGDGRPDIAAISEGSFGPQFPEPSGIRVCVLEKGKWQCAPVTDKEEMSSRLFADRIVAGDINGDGKTDLAIGSLVKMKNLIVWLNEGDRRFVPFNEGLWQEKIYFSVSLEDLNGDGRDDVVAVISGFGREGFMGLRAFVSKPDGFQDMSDGLPSEEAYAAVTTGDLNGEGQAEIVGGTTAGGIKIFTQKEGGWQQVETTGLPVKGMTDIYGVYCIDLNEDGYKDIVVNYARGDEERGGIKVFLSPHQKE